MRKKQGGNMVRVRFAPSPTGLPHVGNIRTALFCWLFARHHNGSFILRVEDTDRERYRPEALDAIMSGLRWLGLDWDEGPQVGGDYAPYFQSQRLEIYHKYARKLVESGSAYYCNCSPERLDKIRNQRLQNGLPPMYDRNCRDKKIESDPTDTDTVIRFKMPLFGKTCFTDELRGEICFENSTFDDIVLIKSDGYPTYHFAVVVDDYLMKISHIMRAEEWIPSAGKHILIYDALGWEAPKFVHLPMILGPDRSKLSKRHGATAITEFEQQGILPEAMFNFLSLLGWSPKDDTEIMNKEELISRFDIDGINTAASVFDFDKLRWMNGEYIRRMTPKQLTARLKPYYEKWGWCTADNPCDDEYLDKVSQAMQERLKVFTDMKELGYYFFTEPTEYDPKGVKKNFKPEVADWLNELANRFDSLSEWDKPNLEQQTRDFANEMDVGAGKVIHPIRLAVSGLRMGPGLFELLEIVGKEKVIARLKRAANWIRENIN
ncbi:glutamate--tRNA ligase [bacterium]|nr:MAG: glutamate--tRNA ligase [bacterium]